MDSHVYRVDMDDGVQQEPPDPWSEAAEAVRGRTGNRPWEETTEAAGDWTDYRDPEGAWGASSSGWWGSWSWGGRPSGRTYGGWGSGGWAPESSGGSHEPDGRGEHFPGYDGKTPFRVYERKVNIFKQNTRLAPARRAGKLLERLEGAAFEATETLDVTAISNPNGVT